MTAAFAGTHPDLHDGLWAKGEALARNLREGYTVGYETKLATRLIDDLTASVEWDTTEDQMLEEVDRLDSVLKALVRDKFYKLATIDHLLAAEDARSYEALDKLVDPLMCEIYIQDNARDAAIHLATDEIIGIADIVIHW